MRPWRQISTAAGRENVTSGGIPLRKVILDKLAKALGVEAYKLIVPSKSADDERTS
jgi:hypothetical protein